MKKKAVASGAEMRIKRLEAENKALRETCEILADKKLMREIRASLKEIRAGKVIPVSKL